VRFRIRYEITYINDQEELQTEDDSITFELSERQQTYALNDYGAACWFWSHLNEITPFGNVRGVHIEEIGMP
jgi:hypothetical protein